MSYARELLPPWAQAGLEAGRLADAFGAAAAQAQVALYGLRRQWVIRTATGPALDEHGRHRGLPRSAGESDDAYRERLLAAFTVRLSSNTPAGLLALLAALGLSVASIYEHRLDALPRFDGAYRYNGSLRFDGNKRWAEFSVILQPGTGISPAQLFLLVQEVGRSKPAHTKLSAVHATAEFAESAAIATADEGALGTWTATGHDGTWSYDGTETYSEVEGAQVF
jgi:hypothetical protein